MAKAGFISKILNKVDNVKNKTRKWRRKNEADGPSSNHKQQKTMSVINATLKMGLFSSGRQPHKRLRDETGRTLPRQREGLQERCETYAAVAKYLSEDLPDHEGTARRLCGRIAVGGASLSRLLQMEPRARSVAVRAAAAEVIRDGIEVRRQDQQWLEHGVRYLVQRLVCKDAALAKLC